MAALSGKSAKLQYSTGPVNVLDNWSVDVDVDMLDVTSFTTGTLQWRSMIAGLSGWTGSAAGHFDVASTALADMRVNTLTPTTAQVVFYMDKVGGENFRGTCFLSGMGHTAPLDGRVDVSFDIQGTGSLTYSTST